MPLKDLLGGELDWSGMPVMPVVVVFTIAFPAEAYMKKKITQEAVAFEEIEAMVIRNRIIEAGLSARDEVGLTL